MTPSRLRRLREKQTRVQFTSVRTFTGVGFASSRRPPGQVVVEILTLLTVQAFRVVGALTPTVHLKYKQNATETSFTSKQVVHDQNVHW